MNYLKIKCIVIYMNKKLIPLESSKKRKYDKTILYLRNISNQLDVMKKKKSDLYGLEMLNYLPEIISNYVNNIVDQIYDIDSEIKLLKEKTNDEQSF